MAKELALFHDAVKDQFPVLIKATGFDQKQLESKLISFAYATKAMLEASKQAMTTIDPQSIREAFKASLDTGIPVDKRQLAYVVKYGNKIEYQIGFKGFISKIKEIYPTASVKAEIVYVGDVFTVEKIDGQAKYFHKVSNPFAKITEMTGVYAYIQYTDKGKDYSFIETMGKDEIMKIRGKAKTKFVWDEWFGEMAKKAVIRRLCKTLFISNPEIQILEDIENKNYDLQQEPVNIDYEKVKEMPKEVQPNKADVIEQQEEIVEQEIKEDTITETEMAENIFIIDTVSKKEGTTKTGKPYILSTLTFEDGTMVKTFDRQDYAKGQTVELVEWDKENGQAKKVNIL